jgi:hypothetical protein
MRRAYRPAGLMRQMLAIGADTGRAKVLARIQAAHAGAARRRRSAGAHRLRQDTAGAFRVRASSPFPAWATTCRPQVCTILAATTSFPFAHGGADDKSRTP